MVRRPCYCYSLFFGDLGTGCSKWGEETESWNLEVKGEGGELYRRQEKREWKGDSQGGNNQKELGKVLQHCIIFCQRNCAKWREQLRTGLEEPGVNGTGSSNSPVLPPPPPTLKDG